MTLNPRQQQIIDRLMLTGEVKLAELKETFDVTEMTLRRDLEKLELTGKVRRIFGGAILVSQDVALTERTGVHTDEKTRIGSQAASFVEPGDSVFIDGGSTTLQLAKSLKPGMNITVVTNALNIASELQGKQISTIVIGGILLEATSTLVGPLAVETLSKLAFDKVFLGATGITVNHGFSNSNMYEAEIKRLAIAQAAETTIVLDHSKFGTKELFSFAELSKVRRLVTDEWPDQELLDACRDASLEVVAAT